MSSSITAWKKAHDESVAEVRKEEGKKKELVQAWLANLKFPILIGLLKELRIPPALLDRVQRVILYRRNLESVKAEYHKLLYGEYPEAEPRRKVRSNTKGAKGNGNNPDPHKPFVADLDPSEIKSMRESIETLNFQINMVDNIMVAMEAEITPFVKFPVPELVEEHKPRMDATELSGSTKAMGGLKALMKEANRIEEEPAAEALEASESEG